MTFWGEMASWRKANKIGNSPKKCKIFLGYLLQAVKRLSLLCSQWGCVSAKTKYFHDCFLGFSFKVNNQRNKI